MTFCIIHGLQTNRCTDVCTRDTESFMARWEPDADTPSLELAFA